MVRTTARAVGDDAESLALRFLLRQGLSLVTRNFHSRFGEIDLVMRDGTELVFVEVRRRQTSRYGNAACSVGPVKQARLMKAAAHFLRKHRSLQQRVCRFDVVGIDVDLNNIQNIDWRRDAFRGG